MAQKYKIKHGTYSRRVPRSGRSSGIQIFRKGDIIEPSPAELSNIQDMLEPVEVPTRPKKKVSKKKKPADSPTTTTTTVTEEQDDTGNNETEFKHVGGGWYQLSDGSRVQGKEAAEAQEKALKE